MLLAGGQDRSSVDAWADAQEPSPARSPLALAVDRCLATLLANRWNSADALTLFAAAGLRAVPDLVAAATQVARTLGERWVADTCSFADVTLGLHRLTLLLIDVEALPDPQRERLHGGTFLLAPAPGDQHGFGLATVALALRRAGWDVTVDLSGSADALVAASRRGFDCIGLSVGHDRAVAPVARLIERLRVAARPRRLTVAIGGPMLLRDPRLATTVGADLSGEDGVALAERLRPLRHALAA